MRKEGENTCGNCFWFSGSKAKGDPFGYCRNPRNARIGRAGSDYNSSNLLEPDYVGVHKVCDYHEVAQPSVIREVFKIKGVSIPRPPGVGYAGYTGYDIGWEREE